MRTTPSLLKSLAFLLGIVLCVPGAVHAQRKSKKAKTEAVVPAAPTQEAKDKARAAYGRGQSEFAAGHHAEARAAFGEAFAAVPNPIVLLGVAESETKLGLVPEATATLQRYLELRKDAPDRADIEAKLKALSETPAAVTVNSHPLGAEIEVDGLPTQKRTPAEVPIAPGEHEVSVSKRGFEAASEIVAVTAGEKRTLILSLKAHEAQPHVAVAPSPAAEGTEAPESPQPAASEPTAADDGAGPSPTVLWITAGVGVAGLVTGSVCGFLALKERSDFDEKPTKASADRGERLALFADVGFGIGAAAAVTIAVLYLTADDTSTTSDSATAKANSQWALSADVGPSHAAASARLSF